MPKSALETYWVLVFVASELWPYLDDYARERTIWARLLVATYRGIPREEHEADDADELGV